MCYWIIHIYFIMNPYQDHFSRFGPQLLCIHEDKMYKLYAFHKFQFEHCYNDILFYYSIRPYIRQDIDRYDKIYQYILPGMAGHESNGKDRGDIQ